MKQHYLSKLIVLIFLLIVGINKVESQVLISSVNDSPHASAMLEIRSNTQGLLIPRMNTIHRTILSLTAADGLLVYDTDVNAFFLRANSAWVNLSSSSEIWKQNGSNVYLSNTEQNVGVGTITPNGKLVIKADDLKAPDDPLFEIQDNKGNPVFVVTSEGARLYINDLSKGSSGGFAVGRYGIAKGLPDTTYFMVSPDSTRVYTDDVAGSSGGFAVGRYGIAKGKQNYYFFTGLDSTRVYAYENMKGSSGGFAVGRYGIAKDGLTQDYSFFTTADSTRVYTSDIGKGSSGGFAVGRYGIAKGNTDNYMFMVPDNYFIGYYAGEAIQNEPILNDGLYNTFFGYQSGMNTTDGDNNIFIGYQSGLNNSIGQYNVLLGNETGYSILSGSDNVLLGYQAGRSLTTAGNNISIGSRAGFSNTNNSDNIFIGRDAGYLHVGNGTANSAINNIYIGLQAGYGSGAGNRGNDNIFMGSQAGFSNIYAQNNIFIGIRTGYSTIGNSGGVNYGSDNIFMGNEAGYANSIGEKNIFIGYLAGRSNTTSDNNVFIGVEAGTANTTGRDNVFIGNGAGISNQIGVYNTIIGEGAGASIVGWMDGMYTRGSQNTFVGKSAGGASTGYENTYIGAGCATYNVNGQENVMMGRYAGFWSSGGSRNTIIGYGAGYLSSGQSLGDGNVLIGYYAAATQNAISNQLFIDNSSTATPLIWGDFTSNTVKIYRYLNVNNAYTFPISDGTANQVLTTNGAGAVSWSSIGGTLVTAGNGLNFDEAPRVELGGALNEITTITQGAYSMEFDLTGTGDFSVNDNGVVAFRINDTGNTRIYNNLGISTTDFGNGTQVIAITNGTAPNSNCTNGVILFAQDVLHSPSMETYSELRVRDEGGNTSTISPHNFSLIPQSEPMAWSFYSENNTINQKINVDMLRAIRIIEELSGEKLVYISNMDNTLIRENYTNEQSLLEKISVQENKIEALEKQIEELKTLIENK
jgi:hypothetical protein